MSCCHLAIRNIAFLIRLFSRPAHIVSLSGSRIAVHRMLNISPLVVGVYGICLFTLAISLFLGAPRNWLEFSLLFPLLVVSAIPIVALPDRRLMARLLRSFEYWLLVFSVVSLCVGFAVQDVAELAVKCQNRSLLVLLPVFGLSQPQSPVRFTNLALH